MYGTNSADGRGSCVDGTRRRLCAEEDARDGTNKCVCGGVDRRRGARGCVGTVSSVCAAAPSRNQQLRYLHSELDSFVPHPRGRTCGLTAARGSDGRAARKSRL
eukprot:7247378-Prymnesium_polylepis.1